jgi:hypothetical protein
MQYKVLSKGRWRLSSKASTSCSSLIDGTAFDWSLREASRMDRSISYFTLDVDFSLSGSTVDTDMAIWQYSATYMQPSCHYLLHSYFRSKATSGSFAFFQYIRPRRPRQFSRKFGRRCFGISNGNLGDAMTASCGTQ